MKIRKFLVCICTIALVLGLTACSAKSESKRDTNTTSYGPSFTPEEAPKENGFIDNAKGIPTNDMGSAENSDLVNTAQKLIKNVNLNLETLEYDNLLSFLDQKIKEFNGYVQESQSYGNSLSDYNLRNANLKIRVPSDRLDEFVHLIGENTTIVAKNESTIDVTSEYVDTESRKKALEIQQDRLFALLEKADKMEDIITLESRISEITYQLESYTSTLRTYDNLVSYSTVSILINEVERVSAPKPEGTWEQMKRGLSDSFYNIKEGLKSFSIWFVVSLPYLIIWAAFIIIAVIVIRKVYKSYNAKYSSNKNYTDGLNLLNNKASDDLSNPSNLEKSNQNEKHPGE